jgi:Golgi complex component 7 (COG7)
MLFSYDPHSSCSYFHRLLLLLFFHFLFYFGTKKDAAGLTKLSASVEDVFASGDLPRAAETLATMRHCLSAVGEVLYHIQILSKCNVNIRTK